MTPCLSDFSRGYDKLPDRDELTKGKVYVDSQCQEVQFTVSSPEALGRTPTLRSGVVDMKYGLGGHEVWGEEQKREVRKKEAKTDFPMTHCQGLFSPSMSHLLKFPE